MFFFIIGLSALLILQDANIELNPEPMKGCIMDTPTAINFGNVFMTKFEMHLMKTFKCCTVTDLYSVYGLLRMSFLSGKEHRIDLSNFYISMTAS